MKKVGLMTCFLDNYGACLQAYALSRVISETGNSCSIINYTEPAGYYSQGLTECLKNNAIYTTFRRISSKKYRTSYKFDKIRRQTFKDFRKQFLPLTDAEYKEYCKLCSCDYDAYVCGSDQIWNPSFYGKCHPAYYLEFVPDSVLKISYAPSIGLSDIPGEYVQDFKTYLQRFHAISVREQNGVELVKKYADRDAKWVLDPTMLLDGKQWSQIATKNIYKKPYIFCYLFGGHDYYIEAIEHLRKSTGYDVCIIPFSERDLAKEYHKIYKAGPIEFISLIKNAQYVLTDSFHATVFSILFERPFFTLLRDSDNERTSMNSRIYSLLSMINKQERCITSDHVSNYEISPITDYAKVHKKLSDLREESLYFLKSSLEEVAYEG